jgi:peptidoglycan/LPS O-acetylase OafA/YrhL
LAQGQPFQPFNFAAKARFPYDRRRFVAELPAGRIMSSTLAIDNRKSKMLKESPGETGVNSEAVRDPANVIRSGYYWLVSRLSRITSSGAYIPEIDGLRFIAISSVFVMHVQGYIEERSNAAWVASLRGSSLSDVIKNGRFGVHLFFVISGFILGLPFASQHLLKSKPVSLRAYFYRRLTRLEPPYLITLTLFLFLQHFMKHIPWNELLPGFCASFFYLHNLIFGNKFGDRGIINHVGWSLEVEVQFYILAPVLALLFTLRAKWPRRILMFILINAGSALNFFWLDLFLIPYPSLLSFFQYFLTGFLFADIYLLDIVDGLNGGAIFWDLVSFAGWAALPFALKFDVFKGLLLAPCMLLLFYALFRSVYCRMLMTLGWITTIGGMCYTIYLVHNQLISVVVEYTKNIQAAGNILVNLCIQAVLIGIPVLAMCAVLFALIEKPCMRKDWPRRLVARVKLIFPSNEAI